MDYYSCPGTAGRFYSWDPNVPGTNSSYGVVAARRGSCQDTADWKGYGYYIDLYNYSGGNRGQYTILHADGYGYADGVLWGSLGNPVYTLQSNQTVYWSTLIGFTSRFNYTNSPCYQVDYDSGAHWHLELANSISVGHYACFYSRSAGADLYAADYFGISGANIYTINTACP